MAGTYYKTAQLKFYKTRRGYMVWMCPKPDGKSQTGIREHVLVMEKFIGRALRKEEQVHHKNGVKDDNRIENLELWSRSQPTGQRVEDKINWAIELLQQYKPEALK